MKLENKSRMEKYGEIRQNKKKELDVKIFKTEKRKRYKKGRRKWRGDSKRIKIKIDEEKESRGSWSQRREMYKNGWKIWRRVDKKKRGGGEVRDEKGFGGAREKA